MDEYSFEADIRNDPSGWLVAKTPRGDSKYWDHRRYLAIFMNVPKDIRKKLHGKHVRITISIIQSLLLLLIASLGLHAQQEPAYTLTVESRLPDGRLTPARIQITDVQGRLVAETHASTGRASFILARGSYMVRASTDVWSQVEAVALDSDRLLVFTVAYPVRIPLDMTIQTPGGFRITFETTKKVDAVVKSGRGGKFTLTVKEFAITFSSNETDVYYVNASIVYDSIISQTVWIETYSETTGAVMRTGIPVHASTLILTGEVRGVPAPKFPTPEEIAKAQAKYIEQMFRDELGKVAAELKQLSGRVGELDDDVDRIDRLFTDMNTKLSGLAMQTQSDIGKLRSDIESFTGNAWASIAVLAAVACGALFTVLLARRGEEETIEIRPRKRGDKLSE